MSWQPMPWPRISASRPRRASAGTNQRSGTGNVPKKASRVFTQPAASAQRVCTRAQYRFSSNRRWKAVATARSAGVSAASSRSPWRRFRCSMMKLVSATTVPPSSMYGSFAFGAFMTRRPSFTSSNGRPAMRR